MKYVLLLAISLLSHSLFAAVTWSNQTTLSEYLSDQQVLLALDGKEYVIPEKTHFQLVSIEALSMLKVYLHKYKIANCPSVSLETDLELMDVNGRSIGVTLVRNCILEVYIELIDYETESFLN